MSRNQNQDAVKEALVKKLEPFNQQHVLVFWEELTDDERAGLAAQIDGLDLGLIEEISKQQGPLAETIDDEADVGPPPAVRLGSIDEVAAAEARRLGEQRDRRWWPPACRFPRLSSRQHPRRPIQSGLLTGSIEEESESRLLELS